MNRNWVMGLAYVNRYVLPALCIAVPFPVVLLTGEPPLFFLVMGGLFAAYALLQALGCMLRSRVIYCSLQDIAHVRMTPDEVDWSRVSIKDCYWIAAIFGVFGAVSVVAGSLMYIL